MEILIKDKGNYISINPNKLSNKKIGGEGDVYEYDKSAIKIYNDNRNVIRLNEHETKFLTEISTKRILLPNNLLYIKENDKIKFNGYRILDYINDTKNISEISNLEPLKLIEEIELIYKDIDNLSLNNVLLCDLLKEDNILFNGNIYFVDPGKHYVDSSLDSSLLKFKNYNSMDMALMFHILFLQENYSYLKENTKTVINDYIGEFDQFFYNHVHYIIKNIYLLEKLNLKDNNSKNFFNYILDVIFKYGTLNNYRAKLIKDALNNKNCYVNNDEVKTLKKIIK